MANILIVDDTPFWLDMTSDALRANGFDVATASNGIEGMASLDRACPDLIILDVDMPGLSGFAFLDQVRKRDRWQTLPVIMLTGDMRREDVLRAKRLGVAGYLLKASFSMDKLMEQVEAVLATTCGSGRATVNKPQASLQHGALGEKLPTTVREDGSLTAGSSHPAGIETGKPLTISSGVSRLLDAETCLRRARGALGGRTLPGAVAEVIALAASPRGDLGELVAKIGRDPLLATRVLQMANSAKYTTTRGTVSTIREAVRNIGCETVRDIAATIGVFDAMPAGQADGFDVVRCWQHSLAVAMLCQHLAPETEKGTAYLVGLCHDLGEMLFRTHFADEYRQVLLAEQSTGRPREDLEREMLGLSHGELVGAIMETFGLPDAIRRPIEQFHDANATGHVPQGLEGILGLADSFANGMLLASSPCSLIRPYTRSEIRALAGEDNPRKPDSTTLRNEVLTLTALLLRPGSAAPALVVNAGTSARIWLARDPAFSAFDPVEEALSAMGSVTVSPRLPATRELDGFHGVIVLTHRGDVKGFGYCDIAASLGPSCRVPGDAVLWLAPGVARGPSASEYGILSALYPIAITRLSSFVEATQTRLAA